MYTSVLSVWYFVEVKKCKTGRQIGHLYISEKYCIFGIFKTEVFFRKNIFCGKSYIALDGNEPVWTV